jgi:uroporphyrinogen III methyltransferase/synthase
VDREAKLTAINGSSGINFEKMKNALLGKSVLITRPRESVEIHDDLAEKLRAAGAELLFQPAIAISDPPDWQPVDETIARIREFDWLVFSSSNGVRYFFERLHRNSRETSEIAAVKIAAIGPSTAQELEKYGYHAAMVPQEYRAESLAESLVGDASGCRFLLIRASRGREVLAERLSAAGARVEQVVAYTSSDIETPDAAISARLAAGEIDWITVSSSSIARALVGLFGENLRRAKLASISPVTSVALREQGFEPAAEAGEFTSAGLAEAILRQAGV